MLKRILINILLIFFILFCFEIHAFIQTIKEDEIHKQQVDKLKSNNISGFKTKYVLLKPFKTSIDRKSCIIDDTDKKPFILFGCSFAEGAGLKDEHTPCYKISKMTNRSCINQTKGAIGPQYMYYRLSNPNFFDNYPEADYIIYVFIWNHLERLYNFQVNPLIYMFNLRYRLDNDVLKEVKPIFKPLYSSFLVKRIQRKIVNNRARNEEIDFELFNKIISESLSITKKNYPDSKFILLEFPDKSYKELPFYEVNKLKSYGIDVVKVTDITKGINIYEKKYWLSDDIHPSEALWDIVLPVLVKEHIGE